MDIKNKKILITAGPTWVPIDKVRVISNIATGETGILLAQKLERLGAKVTLLLGPVEAGCLNKNIRLVSFKFFDELKEKITRELKSKKYALVIHSAAVSDYRPVKSYGAKFKSGQKSWKLNLVPTPKIIGRIKKIDSNLFVVGFKFEPGANKSSLIAKTKKLMHRANLDLAVANSINRGRYLAYIVSRQKIYGPIFKKSDMVKELIGLSGGALWN